MRGAVSRLVCKLALQGLSPIAIAQQTGRSSSNVRSMLSTARGDGVEIPKHGTAPARLVRPASTKRLFADPLVRARIDGEIAQLAVSGMPQRRIARLFGVSLGYVQRVLKRSTA